MLDSHSGTAETLKICSISGFLFILTPDHWPSVSVASRVDSSEEKNPIPQDYFTSRAAEDRQLPIRFFC